MNLVIRASELACVRSTEAVTTAASSPTSSGSRSSFPTEKIPTKGLSPLHAMRDNITSAYMPAYSSRVIPYPSKQGDQQDLIIGGEAAMYHYRF